MTSGNAKLNALVTGGAGFLGKHLVQQLIDSGKYNVKIFDIRDNGAGVAPIIVGNLCDIAQVKAATKDVQVVFHCATASPTGANALNDKLMYSVNVEGTRNVITACQENNVSKLVFTSSASVVFDGRSLNLVNESHPYAEKPMDYYTKTKIMAEKAVLAANGQQGLATCALRPSGIFGEGDPIFVPTLIGQARKGKTKYIIGDGKNAMDFTYVGNVAQAHLQAADALRHDRVAGKAYFITNQDPYPFWGMMGEICGGLGYVRPHIKLPFLFIFMLALLFEYVIRPLLKAFVDLSSDFTVNRILIASANRTFSSKRALQDFSYSPAVSMPEGIARTVAAFPHLRSQATRDPKKNA